MELFRFWRWQLRASRPAIEHIEHRPIEQKMVSIIDGVAFVRDAPQFFAATANDTAGVSSARTHSSKD